MLNSVAWLFGVVGFAPCVGARADLASTSLNAEALQALIFLVPCPSMPGLRRQTAVDEVMGSAVSQ
jgi:hypothetical protein